MLKIAGSAVQLANSILLHVYSHTVAAAPSCKCTSKICL